MDTTSTSANFKALRVKQIPGAATTAGVDYENCMRLLILLRLIECEDVAEFYIAQNVEGCGAFDDLVIKVKYNSSSTAKLILVQLKHSVKNVTSTVLASVQGKGDFQLKKYFESYETIRSRIGKFGNVILNDCSMEDITFVLFTNAKFSVGDKSTRNSRFCFRKLLETGENESDVFKIDSSKQFEKIRSEMEKNNNPIVQGENGLKFLKQMVIFSEQSNTSDLKIKLNKKLKDYTAGSNISVEFALQMALNFITKNSFKWLSQHSGVLATVEFLFQGIPVKLRDAEQFWTKSITRKILVKHICNDMKNGIVCVGKEIEKSEDYYVDRTLYSRLNNGYMKEDYWRNDISNDLLLLICGAPGIGKSSFFTRQVELIKSHNPEKYVIRVNLVDYSDYFSKMDVGGNMENVTRTFLEDIFNVAPGSLEYEIFVYNLHATNMMTIFFDGVDEISPNYYSKLLIVIHTIQRTFQVQLVLSTRPVVEQKMESDLGVRQSKLMEFKIEDSNLFFKKYCKLDKQDFEIVERYAIRDLLNIPIFCRMVGEIINNSSEWDAKKIFENMLNKTQIYDKFVNVMFEVYHQDKLNIDVSKPGVQDILDPKKKLVLEQYEALALLEIFDKDSLQVLKWNIESECNDFLTKILEGEEKTGFVVNIKNGKPIFLHRTIAEYFCGRWFARNKSKYTEFLNINKYFPWVVDYFMSHKLPNQHKLFIAILNVHEQEHTESILAEFKSELNILDSLNRNALQYAAKSKNKWAIRYLLYNGFVYDKKVIYSEYCSDIFEREIIQFWLNTILLKYRDSKTTATHLISLLNHWFYSENIFLLLRNSKHSPLHTAILKENKEDISVLLNSEDINSRNDLGLTPLHLAVSINDKDTVEILKKRGAKYSNNNLFKMYPHQMNPGYVLMKELLKSVYINFMKEDTLITEVLAEDYTSQKLFLHDAVQKKDLQRVKYLIYSGECNINQIDTKGRTALHVAVAGCTDKDYLLVMTLQGIKYEQDFNNLYPHDYDQQDRYRWSEGYAFACGLELLPEEDRKIFNNKAEDIIFKELFGMDAFQTGIRLRQGTYEFKVIC